MGKKSKLPNQSIVIQIHITFNPFKWIYLKSKSIFLDFKSNPFNWVWIIDWIHFWIIQLRFWVGFWLGPNPGWVESIQTHVQLSWPEPMSIQVGLRPYDPSRLGPMSSRLSSCWWESTRANVEPSWPRPISGRCQVESAQAHFGPMSNQEDLGWCWIEMSSRVGTGPFKLMSGWVRLDQCRFELAWAGVEPSRLRSMSSRFDSGRCRAESVQAHLSQCRAKSVQTYFGPMSNWVDLTEST